MENINRIVAANLARLRKQRNLSLEMAAQLTGISKSMIRQIERCEVNPTLATVWKIAEGFKVSFTEFIALQESDYEVIEKSNYSNTNNEAGCRVYSVFPFDKSRRFEIYYVEIDAGASYEAKDHLEETQEFIMVSSGTLEVNSGDHELIINAGSSARLKFSPPHKYWNIGCCVCTMWILMYYPLLEL